jgi:hypothetical protein
MEDKYLQDELKNIEKSNQDYFSDPFFELHFLMQDFYRNFFSEESMRDYTVEINILIQHLNKLMESLDDISYSYTEAEADYHKWRTNSFERVVYKALSKEANIIASMIIQMLNEFEQMSEYGVDYDGMLELKKIYASIANRAHKSSRRVSEYHLENLW